MKRLYVPALFLFAVFQLQAGAQKPGALPRSTPEAEGIPAAAISVFLDSVAASQHEFHSFMLLRHGKVVAEGWWNPYRSDLRHTLYSLSKSFTATAVGFAKAEGKLSLTDRVTTFFPADLPDSVSDNLQRLTVKDLLTMSVGQTPDPTGVIMRDSNWVRHFLALPIKYKPGSTFLYNSMATYMLSAIVQKVTGQKVLDYLKPRLFDPLGIAMPDWETDPKGINTGGWGLRLKTEDIAKFGQLFLQKGKWNGKQILPQGWAEEASAAHILQHPAYSEAQRAASDWEQGYGYQMWRCRNHAFRGDGAFGQYAIVMPEQDAVIAITSETPDMQGELNLIWKILLPAMQNKQLPENKKAVVALRQKLASLSLPVKNENVTASAQEKISGKKFVLEPNAQGVKSLLFDFKNSTCQLKVETDSASYAFGFNANAWQPGETTLPGPYLVSAARNNLAGLPPFKVTGEYTWLDAGTLELVLRYIESPHTETFLCRFDGNAVSVDVTPSFNSSLTVTLKGTHQ